ncbi:uncharacterized protein BDV17DRAFT_194969 [Aspergillus undulatus]|uniref:uncharacterized protein n=1 Tax=Aspergillus undulatus TaxID=1810928 RepID=UPI003CCD8679
MKGVWCLRPLRPKIALMSHKWPKRVKQLIGRLWSFRFFFSCHRRSRVLFPHHPASDSFLIFSSSSPIFSASSPSRLYLPLRPNRPVARLFTLILGRSTRSEDP